MLDSSVSNEGSQTDILQQLGWLLHMQHRLECSLPGCSEAMACAGSLSRCCRTGTCPVVGEGRLTLSSR